MYNFQTHTTQKSCPYIQKNYPQKPTQVSLNIPIFLISLPVMMAVIYFVRNSIY